MGVKAEVQEHRLRRDHRRALGKKCDAIISGMNDTPERRKQVDFVDYLKVGQSLMVKKGNPKHITSLARLSGKRSRSRSARRTRTSSIAASKKLAGEGQAGDQGRSVPEGHRRRRGAQDRQGRRLLRRRAGRRVLHREGSSRSRSAARRSTRSRSGSRSARTTALKAAPEGDERHVRDGTMKKILAKWGCRQSRSRSRTRRAPSARRVRLARRLGPDLPSGPRVRARALARRSTSRSLAQILGVVLGLLAALMRMSRSRRCGGSRASTCWSSAARR